MLMCAILADVHQWMLAQGTSRRGGVACFAPWAAPDWLCLVSQRPVTRWQCHRQMSPFSSSPVGRRFVPGAPVLNGRQHREICSNTRSGIRTQRPTDRSQRRRKSDRDGKSVARNMGFGQRPTSELHRRIIRRAATAPPDRPSVSDGGVDRVARCARDHCSVRVPFRTVSDGIAATTA
jgi:hypothetical protein